MPDGLHPNADGLKLIAKCLKPLIEKLIPSNSTQPSASDMATLAYLIKGAGMLWDDSAILTLERRSHIFESGPAGYGVRTCMPGCYPERRPGGGMIMCVAHVASLRLGAEPWGGHVQVQRIQI